MKHMLYFAGIYCFCIFSLQVKAQPVNRPNTLVLEDIFHLEYASQLQISNDAQTVFFVRNAFDINTDKKVTTLWSVDKQQQLTPLTPGTANENAPTLSPNNEKLAYISTASGQPQIHVTWLKTATSTQLSRLSTPPTNITWSSDSQWLAFSAFVPTPAKQAFTLPPKPAGATWAKPATYIDQMYYRFDGAGYLQSGNQQLFIMSANGGGLRQLTFDSFDHNGQISWTKDNQHIIYSANKGDDNALQWTDSNLYSININSGVNQQLTQRIGPDHSPIVSPNGQWIAYLGYDQNDRNYENTELYIMRLDGSDKRSLTAKLDRSINKILWDNDSQHVYFSYHDHGESYVAKQALTGTRHIVAKQLGGLSLGRPYTASDFDVARDGTIAFTYSNPQRPADIAMTKDAITTKLTHLNADALGRKQLAKIESITVKSSADQRPIQAWIAYPPGYEQGVKNNQKYPLILEIHGGPVTNYGPHFAAEIQLMAAQGYVVVYANPRGSDSYGKAFAQSIYNNYPSQDYDDLMSVVDGVIQHAEIDHQALFVTGGSGGGVLTAWIVGHTNRFKAAVVAKPVINWLSFSLTTDLHSFVIKNWFEKMPWEAPEQYLKLSPITYVGQVSTPTMLLTGEADLRTPIGETEQFYQALKLRGVDTAMVRIPDADHGIYKKPSHLMSKVGHILWWFEKYK
ncbi:S9 family peptidase [Shewanella intestini]|uniref:S9 family peptidase n=2 Tax=Shewanellaceae TaxID=267890 RepID=A0ABS5I671_9GAMM|nr:S9 family peptidase [Shewanella intestini]MRG37557.1 prolyl oligopeptidase family serine peptidase [Shewanella sp. XMDDZSB0408]